MQRSWLMLALAGSALTLSCSGDGSNLAPPEAATGPQFATTATCPALTTAQYNAIITQLGKLYLTTSSTYSGLVTKTNDLRTKLSQGKTADAQQKAFDILKVVFADYSAGKLKAGATTADVQTLVNLLYAATCLGSTPTIPTGGGGVGIITPTGGGKVLSADKKAGTSFPAGAVTVNTVVTITPTTDTLNTMLDKYPPTYEFQATPLNTAVGFAGNVLVGICLDPSTAGISDRLRLAHNIVDAYQTPNRFGKIEILPTASTAGLGLACTTLGSASTFDRLKSYAASLFLPNALSASSAALATTSAGGTTRNYSPFGPVDPQIELSVNAGDGQSATAGTAVATPPSVLAKTATLHTLVPNVPVRFAAASGSGTIVPTTNVLTGTNGVAAATSWTLSPTPGTNTATGTGVSEANAGAQLIYTGSPVTFTATGTPAAGPIGYLSTGYRYLLSSAAGFPPAGFQTVEFDDSGWNLGDAGFGHDGGSNCTLNTATYQKTDWPVGTGDAPTYIIIRKQFTVSSTWAKVGVAIDNDVRVWVDGTEITSSGGSPDGSGFVLHEDCPAQGSLNFYASGLGDGPHLLVVEGRDRGGSSYLDVSVDPFTPIQ